MKKLILTMFGLTLLLTSCSKEGGKTQASLKLSLGGINGISNLDPNFNAGGTILFGRSTSGESFGKRVVGGEENLLIPNGDWTFFAFMWEQNSPGKMMNGKVRCSKIVSKLSGTDLTLNFNLTNANCADPELSNGRTYLDGAGNIRFAEIFVDECDDIDPANPKPHCGIDNQGSALSYRLKFQSFRRGPDGVPLLGPEMIMGACKKATRSAASPELFQKGLEANFPVGNGATPFLVAVEMFLGNDSCTPDAKGSHHVMMNKGLGDRANLSSHVFMSNSKCTAPVLPAPSPADSARQRALKCESLNGMVNSTNCDNIPDSSLRFIPNVAAECAASEPAAIAIKHIVSIPRNRLCDQYLNVSNIQGAHPFAGGNGTLERPYKICNEWQINQIGEFDAPLEYSNKIYKLMNDLDMNKTDKALGSSYESPKCVGFTGGHLERHHNFNSLDKINHGDCATMRLGENNGFQGLFIGNNKTISNARISAEDVNQLGFVREFYIGAQIRNLNFKNLEVRGKYNVGGIAGYADNGIISNIKIDGLDVEANSGSSPGDGEKVGGIAGHNQATIENAVIKDGDVNGKSSVGGLVGHNVGNIIRSGFSGFIDHWDSSGTYVGGLAGYMDGGSIQLSFSEGFIDSQAIYTGGVIGKLNTGSLDTVYSTMSIASRNSGNPNLGGIVGYYNGGNLSNIFYDGSIKYFGAGTPVIYGVSASGASLCYSSFGTPGGSCTPKTYAEMRDGSSLAFSGALGSNWIKTSGSVPRFGWEQRECALADNQKTFADQLALPLSRGGLMNPLIICNASQFKDVDGRMAALNYRVADDINLSSWATEQHLISSFKGSLFGNNHILYGANVTDATNSLPDNIGLINDNTGKIRNLVLVNNMINSLPEEYASGLLVGRNQGVIDNIELYANTLNGYDRVGLVAGENDYIGPDTGVVHNIDAQSNFITGKLMVGGVVGSNKIGAKISHIMSDAKIEKAAPSSYSFIGGIVGSNAGYIDQAQFRGELYFSSTPSTAPNVFIGGIAGSNDGAISNTLVDNYTRISTKNFSFVGGLVGYNSSGASLTKSINLGRLISFDPITAPTPPAVYQPFHATIGENAGGMTDVFYLQNNTAEFLTQAQATSCNGTYAIMSSSAPPFINGTTQFNLLSKDMYGNSGNELQNLSITAVPGTDGEVSYIGDCNPNDYFSFYKKYEPNQTGMLYIGDFADVNNFGAFDIAYDSGNPATDRNVDRLFEYHLSMMENRMPKLPPPIWEIDDHDGYPRLLQVDH